jgi:hypothetical protein
MKLVKHGEAVVAIIEHQWEKAHLKAQQETGEWVALFLPGESTPYAEINPVSLNVRLCIGQELRDQKEVVFHAS